jgi:hypothetical protein
MWNTGLAVTLGWWVVREKFVGLGTFNCRQNTVFLDELNSIIYSFEFD